MAKKKGPTNLQQANRTGKEARTPSLQSRNERQWVQQESGWNTVEEEINTRHERVKGAIRDAIKDGIRIGELLTEKKEELPHGTLGQYISENFPFKMRMAQNYMKLFSYRSQIEPALQNAEITGINGALKLIEEPEKSKSAMNAHLEKYREEYENARKESMLISRKISALDRKKELSKNDFRELEKELKELNKLLRSLKSKF